VSKQKKPPKPIFPLKHEFYASLDHFIEQAGMLADAMRTAIDHGAITNEGVKELLQQRLDAFGLARFGDEEDGPR
jgi:hypothetical protein